MLVAFPDKDAAYSKTCRVLKQGIAGIGYGYKLDRGVEKMTDKEYKRYSLREFDKAAEKFDDNSPSVYNMCRKDYPDIIEEIEKEEWVSLLDAGCGTGAVISLLQEKYPDKNYTGIDLSSKMIEAARRKNVGVDFICGDCEELPFERNCFDVVICSQSFHHYPNPKKFLLNVQRVLKPGGRLILRDMTAKSSVILWFINHIEIPMANRLFKKGDVKVYSKNDIAKLCEYSGLIPERVEARKWFRLHCVCRKGREEHYNGKDNA